MAVLRAGTTATGTVNPNMKSKLLFIVWGAMAGMCSCSTEPSLEIRVAEITGEVWSNSSPADVLYENSDTLGLKTIQALIRFRNDFQYDRLDFVVETLTPDSLIWRDTLSVSYREGAPVETTSLTYTDLKTDYRSQSRLGRTGTYRFRFIPAMPESYVENVIGAGIEITTL